MEKIDTREDAGEFYPGGAVVPRPPAVPGGGDFDVTKVLEGETMKNTPTQKEIATALKTVWQKMGGTVAALVVAFAAFGEISRDTEWQDVDPEAKVGEVVEQFAAGATNAALKAAHAYTDAATNRLSAVAHSGSYADLKDKPEIPTDKDFVPWATDSSGNKTAITSARKTPKEVGAYSLAVGFRTTASGENSHAEGERTYAVGVNSHAEGTDNNALGESSHSAGIYASANDSISYVWNGQVIGYDSTKPILVS